MSRWRVIVVALLVSSPVLALAGFGSYYLWKEGVGFIVWWPMTAILILGYVLGWYWQRNKQLLRPVDFTPPLFWTDRDKEAWKLVETRAQEGAKKTPEQLSEFQFYTDTAKDMALQIARFYHPKSRDPMGSLTVPEILAVVELVSHDLADMVEKYLPGGHLLTINNWRQAKQVSDWYQTANKLYWLVSAIFSPVTTGVKYVTSQVGMSRPLQLLQQNLILWFYTAFVHRLGTYLIDLNSGRLRVGAHRYQELRDTWSGKTDKPVSEGLPPDGQAAFKNVPPTPTTEAKPARHVSMILIGQVKAGKSSLINALLGDRRAMTDVLPATNEITRYELQPPGISSRFILMDTVGYGHKGPREDQLRATQEAARDADLILLVMHARNPARQADLDMVKGLRSWFASKPELKMPPLLGILTHIDLLSPSLEWAPPYNWVIPARPKEHQIQQAWATLKEQLGDYLVGIVPLCTEEGKVYGIEEWLLPTVAKLLDEAHAVALLRCLRAEANTANIRRVFFQLLETGKQVAQIAWANDFSMSK